MSARNRFLGFVKCVCVVAAVGTVLLASSSAWAGLLYWGGATGANWSDSKWSSADGGPYTSPWGDGSSARLNSTGPITLNVTSPVSLCGISFGDTGYDIAGGTLSLTGGTAGFTLNGVNYTNAFGMGGTTNSSRVDSNITGTGGMHRGGSGEVVFGGALTYTGDTDDLYGILTIADTGSMLFGVANSSSNKIFSSLASGSKPSASSLHFNGAMKLDVSAVTNSYGSWTLVDGTNFDGTLSYGSTFAVQKADGTAFADSSGVWTLVDGPKTWTFTQSTGVLAVTPSPEPGAIILAGTGLLGLLAYAWRRRR
jgi:MYXO-CTERM domain-containing protein